jgi:hypothetical protein
VAFRGNSFEFRSRVVARREVTGHETQLARKRRGGGRTKLLQHVGCSAPPRRRRGDSISPCLEVYQGEAVFTVFSPRVP